jgi:hypothetical protein
LILAEQARLRLGGHEIGVGSFAIARAVEVFGPQHGIADKDRGSRLVEFSSPRMGKRAVDTFAHQRVSEYEPIPCRPHENVSRQRVAGILRFPQQLPEMKQTELLAENRGCLDRATILGRQQIGPGEHNALNGSWETSVSQVPGTAEQLFEKQRIAARALDALGCVCVRVNEFAGND